METDAEASHLSTLIALEAGRDDKSSWYKTYAASTEIWWDLVLQNILHTFQTNTTKLF